MNFGTSLIEEGGVLFRLWAPEVRRVDLCLIIDRQAGPEVLPMTRHAGGWFVLYHKAAKVGDLYQFLIDENLAVPDPASRCQAQDVHGPSVICNPLTYQWEDREWRGRPWEEAVIYELHVGAFSPQGTFSGVTKRIDYLLDLGVTAIELMPLCQFPGRFNWGYDGALFFAPDNTYGSPEDLKKLIDTAHQKGLMVFLDVVYNHFGPEGNYLYVYAKNAFFTDQFHTPWGAAINFNGPQSRVVRDFYIANALYWLEEYHLDGLRFDAVHAIFDPSSPDILEEISQRIQRGPGRRRHIHLILENDNNASRYLGRRPDGQPQYFVAQWNDDFHHACHTLLTGESEGYYRDYRERPIAQLGRCLAEGFAYQGEKSLYRGGRARGEPSSHLPPLAFVSFLQNHDQIGNRALGERIISVCEQGDLQIMIALFLLAPSPPLLFMGEEFGAQTPFLFFCDFGPELAESVTAGRRSEFKKFRQFSSPESRKEIPDPNSAQTFSRSKLDWQMVDGKINHFQAYYRQLLNIRRDKIVPLLPQIQSGAAGFVVVADKALKVWWQLANTEFLTVVVNLHEQGFSIKPPKFAKFFYNTAQAKENGLINGHIPPKSIAVFLEKQEGTHV